VPARTAPPVRLVSRPGHVTGPSGGGEGRALVASLLIPAGSVVSNSSEYGGGSRTCHFRFTGLRHASALCHRVV